MKQVNINAANDRERSENTYQRTHGVPGQVLNQYQKMAQKNLPPGYICNRCNKSGHLIKECPTNSDPNFDPHKGKGVPKN
jgi:Zinc knuckle